MSIKSFITKKALQFKGMPEAEAKLIAEKLENNPALVDSFKKLEENKELKTLFEKIQKEIEEKKKTMGEQYAMLSVMAKYKTEITKHREDLAPLIELMQK